MEVLEDGTYDAVLSYGTPLQAPRGIGLYVDGVEQGVFKVPPHAANNFAIDQTSTIPSVKLSKGRHLLTIITYVNGVNLSNIDFIKK